MSECLSGGFSPLLAAVDVVFKFRSSEKKKAVVGRANVRQTIPPLMFTPH